MFLGIIALAIVMVVGGCGRTPSPDPPFECQLDGDDPGAGCAFVAGPGLHLSGVDSVHVGSGDPDAVVIVNPHPSESLRLRVWETALGEDTSWPRGASIGLGPGEHRVVDLPRLAVPTQTERRQGGVLRIEGSRPFTATAFRPHRASFGNGSELLMPEEAVGRTYVVASYPPHPAHFQGAGEPSFFEVIALEDDTEVRWRPPVDTAGDGDTLAPVVGGRWSESVVLSRHESLRVRGTPTAESDWSRGDVSGTVIEASAPVVAIGGSRCAAVPPSSNSLRGCDPLSEQLVPIEYWGRHVAVPHPPLRVVESHYVRIYAGEDGVRVQTDPREILPQPTVLAVRGDYLDVVVPHGTSFAVDADGPVLAVGVLATRELPTQIGDSAMVQFVPTSRFLSRYVITTAESWATERLQAVRPVGAAAVEVNGRPIEGWESFGGYEQAEVEIATGVHTITSEQPFGLLQFGWTNEARAACATSTNYNICHTAYAHAAGMRLR